MKEMVKREKIIGIDFSGARDAGSRIWITTGIIRGETLHITDCLPAKSLHTSGEERRDCYAALRAFVLQQGNAVTGMDFPFGLPRKLVREEHWEDFIISFRNRFRSVEEFRTICRGVSGGKEIRRTTDIDAKTPFSPYNLRLYRQTYYGITEILEQLIKSDETCVLPMQPPCRGRTWIVEICPASTLKQEKSKKLYLKYKGKTAQALKSRARIIRYLEHTGLVSFVNKKTQKTAVENYGGDAIDSVVAAFATFRNYLTSFRTNKNPQLKLEGYVYI